MILCDAGPLIALVDRRQADHDRCRETFNRLSQPMVTTWPCFTEAMHFLGRRGGWAFQRNLWLLVNDRILRFHRPTEPEVERIQRLMEQYHNFPMDLSDASLVAAAEAIDLPRVFTLDQHFLAYRLNDGRSLEVVPS
jgi:uncharacterized protein